jgi:membrane glycosyltransferase
MVLAVPLVLLTASPEIGRLARRLGLFLIPAETDRLQILERVQTVLKSRQQARFYAHVEDLPRLAQEDPYVGALHAALLRDVTG